MTLVETHKEFFCLARNWQGFKDSSFYNNFKKAGILLICPSTLLKCTYLDIDVVSCVIAMTFVFSVFSVTIIIYCFYYFLNKTHIDFLTKLETFRFQQPSCNFQVPLLGGSSQLVSG